MKKPIFMYPLLALNIVFFGVSITLKAQSSASTDERVIRQVLSDYYKALSEVDINKDKQSVLKFYHTVIDRNISQLSVQAGYRTYNENLNQFSEFLEQGIREYERERVNTIYTLGQIYAISTIGDITITSFIANYEDRKGGEIFARGKHDNTFTLRKVEDSWKIIKAEVAWIEEQVLKGQCYCWLYENKGESNAYVLRISSPQGTEKRNDLLQVKIVASPSKGEKIFSLDGKGNYRWLDSSTTELHRIDEAGKNTRLLGKPRNQEEVISFILQYDVFEKNCVRVNIRK